MLELLGQLVQQSLVTMEERGGVACYRLLDTTRCYARERLEAGGEAEAVRDRHAAYLLDLAARARPELEGERQVEWLDRLESVLDDLRSALAWLTRPGAPTAEAGLRLAGDLNRFWWLRGHRLEAREWLRQALAHPGARDPGVAAARIGALRCVAGTAVCPAEFPAALAHLEECVSLCAAIGDQRNQAYTLQQIGHIRLKQANLTAAALAYQQGWSIARAGGDDTGVARSLVGLAHVACQRGDLKTARAFLEEGQGYWWARGDTYGTLGFLTQLGTIAERQGDHCAARLYYQRCLTLARGLRHDDSITWSLCSLATIERLLGNVAVARDTLREGLLLFQQLSLPEGMEECLLGLAQLAAEGDETERAARLLGAAHALRERSGRAQQADIEAAWDACGAILRQRLGEGPFVAAWTTGQMMVPVEAIEYALVRGAGA